MIWSLSQTKKERLKVLSALFLLFAVSWVADGLEATRDTVLTAVTVAGVETKNAAYPVNFRIRWGEKVPSHLARKLAQKRIKTTVFVTSPWARSYPDLVQKMIDSGQEIANAGHEQTDYGRYDEDYIRRQIRESDKILAEITGESPERLLLPVGSPDSRIRRLAAEEGYQIAKPVPLGGFSQQRELGPTKLLRSVRQHVERGRAVVIDASDSTPYLPEILPQLLSDRQN